MVQRVADAVNASTGAMGGVAAHVLDFSGIMEDRVCVGGCCHPSQDAHARMAELSAKRIHNALGWSS